MGLRDLLATVLALVQAPSSAARWRVLGAGAGALLLVLAIVRWSATQRRRPDPRKGWHYDRLKRVVLRESLPAMIVDLVRCHGAARDGGLGRARRSGAVADGRSTSPV